MKYTGHRRTGATLLELVIVIALLAVVASVTTLAARPSQSPPDARARRAAAVAEARKHALHTGASVRISVAGDDDFARALSATAMPDGQVVGDARLRIDQLTGRGVQP